MDRKFRAIVLTMSEIIEHQRRIIDDSNCNLEVEYYKQDGFQLSINQKGVCTFGVTYMDGNRIKLQPLQGTHPVPRTDIFTNALTVMNLQADTYCLVLMVDDDRIIFLSDGTVHLSIYDDTSVSELVKVILDPVISFAVLLELYKKNHIEVLISKWATFPNDYQCY
jgi:hypothetical protein